MKKIVNLWLLSCILTLVACGQKAEKQQEVKEDTAAKKMLQGIWLNDDDEDDVAFRVKGDTIYYPDSTSQPVYFYIAGDTLVMKGANIAKYPIVKQAEHIFQFNSMTEINRTTFITAAANKDNHPFCKLAFTVH